MTDRKFLLMGDRTKSYRGGIIDSEDEGDHRMGNKVFENYRSRRRTISINIRPRQFSILLCDRFPRVIHGNVDYSLIDLQVLLQALIFLLLFFCVEAHVLHLQVLEKFGESVF